MGWWVVLHLQQRQPGRPGVHGPAHGRSSMSFSSATRIGLFGVGDLVYGRSTITASSTEPSPSRSVCGNIKDVMLRTSG